MPPLLQTPTGSYQFATSPEEWATLIRREATTWTYVIRNRRRWIDTTEGVEAQRARAIETLLALGLSSEALDALAVEKILEVVIPYQSEDEDWETRIFPWEYVISNATAPNAAGDGLTVFRRLEIAGRTPRPLNPAKILYVESAPGGVAESYSFDSEEALVRSNLRCDAETQKREFKKAASPTPKQLSRIIEAFKPDIVHLAGFDSHQGRDLEVRLRPEREQVLWQTKDRYAKDGYMMAGDQRQPFPVDSETLGLVLSGRYHADHKEGHCPFLVGCNIWNSGARVAPMAVANGVKAAIGFQDSLADELMELFYATFYMSLQLNHWDLRMSFEEALRAVHAQPEAGNGSGVVMWTDHEQVPIVARMAPALVAVEPPPKLAPPIWLPDPGRIALTSPPIVVPAKGIKPCDELNYSALHNGEPLFESFTLLNQSTTTPGEPLAQLADVDVHVVLSTGSETATYDRRLTITGPIEDLRRHIQVPLTSELLRSAREAVNSSMLVEVTWGKVIYRDTHRVRLLPIDQWRDNEDDGKWLPSFVLPRDPEVVRLIEKAQRYVRVLRDDPSTGFDGYQSIDAKATDPTADVDLQVQAIWSTVIHELSLGYINPPPSYSNEMDSQRLRTPTMTIKSQCGTCIDLALLLAACLELVDIYPVIFLLHDHAFPGYWRDPDSHANFMKVNVDAEELAGEDKSSTHVAGSQRHGWWLKNTVYDEIVRQVRLGNLVPLESVWLTEQSGFWDASDGGRQNLKSRRRFHSMLDIAKARELHVTPLPMWGNHD